MCIKIDIEIDYDFKKFKFSTMKKLSYLFAVVFSILMLQSCMKDQGSYNSKNAPKLPALESFTMKFNDFSTPDKNGINGRTVDNFLYSAGNVLVWNTLVTVHLYIPVAAFAEALKQNPEYQGNGIWLWSYDVTDNQHKTYLIKLYGELLLNDEVKWDMYVSQVGGFANMHWFSGITARNNSYAHWTLNFDTADPKPLIKIDFTKTLNQATIRYTNMIPGSQQNGSYIEYKEAVINGTEFDRAFDVFAADLNNLLQINWNSIYKNGRVKDFKKYNDDYWHCWDTQLQDIDCN